MEKIAVHDLATGGVEYVYPHVEFMAECAAYCYDRTYKHFLALQRQKGASPIEAMAALREKFDAKTKPEKAAIWQAKLEGWREAREAKERRPVGRPPNPNRVPVSRAKLITLAQCKTRIAAAILTEIVAIEKRHQVEPEAVQLFDGMRKQLGAW